MTEDDFAPYIFNGCTSQQGGPGDFDRSVVGPHIDPEDEELLSFLDEDEQ